MLHRDALKWFGFERNPFVSGQAPSNEMYLSPEMTAILRDLRERLSEGGLAALIGPVGAGKTTILRRLLEAGDFAACVVQDPDQPTVRIRQVQTAIAQQVCGRDLHYRGGWGRVVRSLQERSGQRVLVICDDAHHYGVSTILAARRMSEICDPKGMLLLSILLVGQPPLARTVADYSGDTREVSLRCETFVLKGFERIHIRHYLAKRFSAAGAEMDNVITDDGITALCESIPRMTVARELLPFFQEGEERRRFSALDIHRCAAEALWRAWKAGAKKVTERHVLPTARVEATAPPARAVA